MKESFFFYFLFHFITFYRVFCDYIFILIEDFVYHVLWYVFPLWLSISNTLEKNNSNLHGSL